LSALVTDPNVTIHEAKVFVCNVTKGYWTFLRGTMADR
jgi:hypothetical protein